MSETEFDRKLHWQDRLRAARGQASADKSDEIAETMQRYSGLARFIIRRALNRTSFEADGLIGFLGQLPPRQIPESLRQQFQADRFPIFVGGGFVLGGLLFFVLGLTTEFKNPDGPDVPAWAVPAAGALMMLIGGAIAGCGKYFERRKIRLLKNGRVIDGTIAQLEPSALVMGNERVFDVRLETADGEMFKTSVKGLAAHRAKELKDQNANTPALQDPRNPFRVLLIECYTRE